MRRLYNCFISARMGESLPMDAEAGPREGSAAAPEGGEEPMLYCPVCSTRLAGHKCKLVCPQCGYYMSCADYY